MEYIDDLEFREHLLKTSYLGAQDRYMRLVPCTVQEAENHIETLRNNKLTSAEEAWLNSVRITPNIKYKYIAGGFLRDSLLGRPVKDIDVYLQLNNEAEIVFLQDPYYKKLGEEYQGDPHNWIRNVYQCTINGLERLNIITLPTSIDFQEFVDTTFDIGLCKIYYNLATDELTTLEDFDNDMKNKTLTISHYDPSNDHLKRLLSKYPKYNVVVKEKKEEEVQF